VKSKFIIMCGILIILLLFNSLSAFSKSPDEATYEKYYHKYVDSPEPLSVLHAREIQFYHSYNDYIRDNYLKPSYTFTYGPHELQALDIYVHHGVKAPVIFFIHSGYEDKIQVQVAVRQWLSLGYTVVSINHRQISSDKHPQAGPKTNFTDQQEDCFLALKWVIDNIWKYGADGIYYTVWEDSISGDIQLFGRKSTYNIGAVNDKYSPSSFTLYQNYPNPFNPSTTISYRLNEKGFVKLMIYDIKGSLIKTLVSQTKDPGSYETEFNAKGLASGVYFYRLEVFGKNSSPAYSDIKKLVLLK